MPNTKQHDATPAPGKLVDIFELSELKGRSVRQLRGMLAKGILTHYKIGYRSILFNPAHLKPFQVKSVTDRNGGGRMT